jgi:CRP/FNR family transcriptional regulator, cyclic AMP receptor protein
MMDERGRASDQTEFLKTIPIMGGLGEGELCKLAEFLKEKSYATGEVIVREGEQAKELFIVKSGQVEIYKEVPDQGLGIRIAVLKQGECFGEMALIDIMPRSASVRALSECTVLCLTYPDFHSLRTWRVETFTLLLMNIAREISRRLRLADCLLAEYNIWWGRGGPPE